MIKDCGGSSEMKKDAVITDNRNNGDAYCDKEERTIQSQDNHVCTSLSLLVCVCVRVC